MSHGDIRLVCKHCGTGHFLLPVRLGERVLRFSIFLDVRDGTAYPDEIDGAVFIQEDFPTESYSKGIRGDKRKSFSKAVRRTVFQKTKGRCHLCKCLLDFPGPWAIDHVLPLSKGGSNHICNLLPACEDCNNNKSNHTPLELELIEEFSNSSGEKDQA